jgi:hypothetical protein
MIEMNKKEIDPERIEEYLQDEFQNLLTALQKQNYYSYTEALEDLTALVNKFWMAKE